MLTLLRSYPTPETVGTSYIFMNSALHSHSSKHRISIFSSRGRSRINMKILVILLLAMAMPILATAPATGGTFNATKEETEVDLQRGRISGRPFMNVIDSCWRRDSNWARHRMRLALCAKGFGASARGGSGKGAKFYTVTRGDDDHRNPAPRTLRYAVTRPGRLWIVFASDMNIRLKTPLAVTSHKTIDGRGANVRISNGPCIHLYNVTNVIIHGISMHNCRPSDFRDVRSYVSLAKSIGSTDGDAIAVRASRHVWIDHNDMSASHDGLLDVTLASTDVTISNNRFSHHDKVMLLGHSDEYTADRRMRVTVAFNRFGPNCRQRMPRVRFGYAHVVNNVYQPWGLYAIGGSAAPAIRSEGNRFQASNDASTKAVTRWMDTKPGIRVRSVKDLFVNGAYFVERRAHKKDTVNPKYSRRQRFTALRGAYAASLARDAGVLRCFRNRPCY